MGMRANRADTFSMVVRVLGMWFASSVVLTPLIAQLVKHRVAPAQPVYARVRNR